MSVQTIDLHNDPLDPLPLTFRMWETGDGLKFEGTASAPAWVSVENSFPEPGYDDYDFTLVVTDDDCIANGYELTIAGDIVAHLAEFWNTHAGHGPYAGPIVGIEAWAPAKPADDGTPRWIYSAFPHLRAQRVTTFETPYGETLPALTFASCGGGTAWGNGPYPVLFTDDGDELRPSPANWDDRRALYALTLTTMSPTTALQYSEHATEGSA